MDLNIIKHLNLDSINNILLEINKRDDIYIEWIDKNDYPQDFIEKCKDYKYNLLDLEKVNIDDGE